MKLKTIYVCSECGESASKWSGKCLQCQAWNSLVEDVIDAKKAKSAPVQSLKIRKVSLEDSLESRLATGISEFDRVLGGGILSDSLMLLSGDPGIGKSTLALQVSLELAKTGKQVLYISGEESVQQISQRARRLVGADIPESFGLINAFHLESVLATIDQQKPDLVIADSVQTFRSDEVTGVSGSISQTRHIADAFMMKAKHSTIPILLIGHVTKAGNLAGPKVLEHLVDTVLYFEGEKYQDLRLLRALKNRFGSTQEVGLFSMNSTGLDEVKNPSELFLNGREPHAIGSALTVTLEGSRPFLLEIQGLTNPADYQYPKRTASGVEMNRLHVLIAVLNKHGNLKLDQHDVYVNVPGGFRVKDPAVDLAVVAALMSSQLNTPLPESTVFLGEVGLSGEIRPVSQEDRRLHELKNLGIKHVCGAVRTQRLEGLNIKAMKSVQELRRFIKK